MWLLLISLVALDLVPPTEATPRAAAGLTVRLELAAGHYEITHRYGGVGARRFVTGATDRNCDEPIDVLIVDGKRTQLYSNLPCGGFAFRAARTVQPGGSWSIDGELDLGEGNHTVVARYCPTTESLKAVDPRVRDASGPPWWLGCVDSPPVRTSLRK